MAKQKQNVPISDDGYKTLCEVETMCMETGEYLAKCSECGINVDPEVRKNKEQAELARNIRAKFFPNRK